MVFGVMQAVTVFVRVFPAAALSSLILLVAISLPAYAAVPAEMDLRHLIERMDTAYAQVNDYQTKVHVEARSTDGTYETETFLYSFEKPDRIRVDFESPHSGLVLVYPDKNDKALVRPFRWAPFFKLRLDPNSSLLDTPSGQPINQTDLGLLIKNIGHSLTDQRRGPVSIQEEGDLIQVTVLAEDHFRKGVLTLYRFSIDRKLWLPVGVRESTSEGVLERNVTFGKLRFNIHFSPVFFQLDAE
jgi:outer membrane lipoprotein-sorting protein